jgi:hypothetical protein
MNPPLQIDSRVSPTPLVDKGFALVRKVGNGLRNDFRHLQRYADSFSERGKWDCFRKSLEGAETKPPGDEASRENTLRVNAW